MFVLFVAISEIFAAKMCTTLILLNVNVNRELLYATLLMAIICTVSVIFCEIIICELLKYYRFKSFNHQKDGEGHEAQNRSLCHLMHIFLHPTI